MTSCKGGLRNRCNTSIPARRPEIEPIRKQVLDFLEVLVGIVFLVILAMALQGCDLPQSSTNTEPASVTGEEKEKADRLSLPDRPKDPALDYAGECIWLTNHVLGPPDAVKEVSEQQLKFLKDCMADKENWRKCREYSDHVWGNNDKARSEFFYKCLDEVSRSIESSCCYAAWDCGTDLHYEKNKREEISEKCAKYCDKVPNNRDNCFWECNH